MADAHVLAEGISPISASGSIEVLGLMSKSPRYPAAGSTAQSHITVV